MRTFVYNTDAAIAGSSQRPFDLKLSALSIELLPFARNQKSLFL